MVDSAEEFSEENQQFPVLIVDSAEEFTKPELVIDSEEEFRESAANRFLDLESSIGDGGDWIEREVVGIRNSVFEGGSLIRDLDELTRICFSPK